MRHQVILAFVIGFFAFPVIAAASPSSSSSSGKKHYTPSANTASPLLKCATCNPPGDSTGGDGGGGNSPPPVKVSYFAVDPQQGTVTVKSSNGVSIVFNDRTNKVTVSAPVGSSVVSMHDVLMKWANDDSATASDMRSRIHAMVDDPKNTTMLVPGTSANKQAMGMPTQRDHTLSMQPNMIMGMPGGYSFGCSLYYNCSVVGMSDFGSGWGPYTIGYWSTPHVGYPPQYPHDTPDYRNWERWRDDHCDDLTTDKLDFVGSGLIFLGSCAASETGIGAVGCAATYVTTVAAGRKMSIDKMDCNSKYPGPDNWY